MKNESDVKNEHENKISFEVVGSGHNWHLAIYAPSGPMRIPLHEWAQSEIARMLDEK